MLAGPANLNGDCYRHGHLGDKRSACAWRCPLPCARRQKATPTTSPSEVFRDQARSPAEATGAFHEVAAARSGRLGRFARVVSIGQEADPYCNRHAEESPQAEGPESVRLRCRL